MSGLATLLRKELLEQWRTARLPVVATVFLMVGLSSPLLARFAPEILNAVGGDQFQIILPTPTAADAYDQLAKNLGQFGALIAILLAMGSVATEKERGTAALILTKPASRAAFLIAKIVAIATTLGVATAIAAAGAWFYTTVLFEPLPIAGFVAATILQWLALMSYATITFVGSTLTRSALAAAGLGVAALIVLGVASIVPAIGRYLPSGLGLPAHGLALGQAHVDVIGPTIASAVMIVGLVAVAWLAFRRQEL
jgi:ABC-2 type transport system permease protein